MKSSNVFDEQKRFDPLLRNLIDYKKWSKAAGEAGVKQNLINYAKCTQV